MGQFATLIYENPWTTAGFAIVLTWAVCSIIKAIKEKK